MHSQLEDRTSNSCFAEKHEVSPRRNKNAFADTDTPLKEQSKSCEVANISKFLFWLVVLKPYENKQRFQVQVLTLAKQTIKMFNSREKLFKMLTAFSFDEIDEEFVDLSLFERVSFILYFLANVRKATEAVNFHEIFETYFFFAFWR